jgi:hypothetical protein
MNRYPIVDAPRNPDDMGQICQFLNDVLLAYGPPCEFCVHFPNRMCEKGHRTRKYIMKYGPYEDWTIRKHCKDHEGEPPDTADETARRASNALDCDAQMYGG